MNERVFIIGGGPSVQTNDLKKLGQEDTIVVNKSVFFVPNPNHFITMDYTVLRKLGLPRVASLKCSRHFVLNMSIDYIQNKNGVPTDIRNDFKYNQLYDVFDSIIVCRREDGLGQSIRDFRCGNNSGYSALQLAFILGYKEIYLVGFDMSVEGQKTHFHSGYRENANVFGKRVQNYTKTFVLGIREAQHKYPDVKVFSCSPKSSLNNVIPHINLGEIVK